MRPSPIKTVSLLGGIFCCFLFLCFYRQLIQDQMSWEILTVQQDENTTEAPCSLRNEVRRHSVFRRKFLFSVPVLQWTKSFTKLTWEQLKNHAPPYGWKGLPAKVLNSTLSLLKRSELFDRRSPGRCIRCAVVGNGGILRGSRQGRNIDNHDFVFRMNGAVIAGFEEDVGTKTSFYGFTANTLKHALIWYHDDGFTKVPQSRETKYIFIPSDLRDYVMLAAAIQGRAVSSGRDRGDRPWKYFGHQAAEKFKLLHPAFISYVTHKFLSSPLLVDVRTRKLYMPSTGALMLMTALHTCDQVSAFGFLTRNYASFSDHYYDSVWRPLKFYANHDLQMEGRLWEELHRQSIIVLYQRS
ncbi:alpha-N-acetylgalactosaminide alpha-2,6-sialyltransferase 2 [Archocentrus centrarchus]|uniref:alpha-N-acetylgalactosaminide alpha-2,6-sialyltransferase 2 n=1 Tax=Archocentrus centrarchus TaxID=63155 RepID=UPI0011E9E3E4|nr:alpha-N-acetylgalactosaminide alpha-2,6-sialyltransferase 2 [Archocentrus centrarchus]